MISINISKYLDLLKIICAGFLIAFIGEYLWGWDYQFGMLFGLILGAWESIYQMMSDRVLVATEDVIMNEDDAEELEIGEE